MTHTSTEQERAEFEAWKEDYALTFEPNYDEHLEADCKAAFLAGMQAARRLQVVPQGWKMVPVGWQFYEDSKWWNGDDRIKDHRKNTEEASYPIRDVYAVEQQSTIGAGGVEHVDTTVFKRLLNDYADCLRNGDFQDAGAALLAVVAEYQQAARSACQGAAQAKHGVQHD